MKTMYLAVGTALLCSTALMAQSSMDKTQMDKDKTMKSGTVTVTGCVTQGSDMSHFTLTKATMADKMAPMKPDTAAPAMTGDQAMMMSYELDGGELKAHLGHKVEVTGTMDKSAMMDHDKTKMGTTGTAGEAKMDKDKAGMAHKDMMAGKIKVKSVKMLATSCE